MLFMMKTIMFSIIMHNDHDDHVQAVDTRQLAKENTFNTSFSSNGDRPPIQVIEHYDKDNDVSLEYMDNIYWMSSPCVGCSIISIGFFK